MDGNFSQMLVQSPPNPRSLDLEYTPLATIGNNTGGKQQTVLLKTYEPSGGGARNAKHQNQETCSCGGEQKILQLQHDIEHLQGAHGVMLVGLHSQIEELKLKNRDLTFQLVMNPMTSSALHSIPFSPESDELSVRSDHTDFSRQSAKSKSLTSPSNEEDNHTVTGQESNKLMKKSGNPLPSISPKQEDKEKEPHNPQFQFNQGEHNSRTRMVFTPPPTDGDSTAMLLWRAKRGRAGHGDPRQIESLDFELLEQEALNAANELMEERRKTVELTSKVEDLQRQLSRTLPTTTDSEDKKTTKQTPSNAKRTFNKKGGQKLSKDKEVALPPVKDRRKSSERVSVDIWPNVPTTSLNTSQVLPSISAKQAPSPHFRSSNSLDSSSTISVAGSSIKPSKNTAMLRKNTPSPINKAGNSKSSPSHDVDRKSVKTSAFGSSTTRSPSLRPKPRATTRKAFAERKTESLDVTGSQGGSKNSALVTTSSEEDFKSKQSDTGKLSKDGASGSLGTSNGKGEVRSNPKGKYRNRGNKRNGRGKNS